MENQCLQHVQTETNCAPEFDAVHRGRSGTFHRMHSVTEQIVIRTKLFLEFIGERYTVQLQEECTAGKSRLAVICAATTERLQWWRLIRQRPVRCHSRIPAMADQCQIIDQTVLVHFVRGLGVGTKGQRMQKYRFR